MRLSSEFAAGSLQRQCHCVRVPAPPAIWSGRMSPGCRVAKTARTRRSKTKDARDACCWQGGADGPAGAGPPFSAVSWGLPSRPRTAWRPSGRPRVAHWQAARLPGARARAGRRTPDAGCGSYRALARPRWPRPPSLGAPVAGASDLSWRRPGDARSGPCLLSPQWHTGLLAAALPAAPPTTQT